jgi:hypothetical protein
MSSVGVGFVAGVGFYLVLWMLAQGGNTEQPFNILVMLFVGGLGAGAGYVVRVVRGGSTRRGVAAGDRGPAVNSSVNEEPLARCPWCGGMNPTTSDRCAQCYRPLPEAEPPAPLPPPPPPQDPE